MPSHSLQWWSGQRSEALDEIANAHAQVGGTERGRRFATQQINQAYATLLSSQFQGFCRDLHSECVGHIVAASPADLRVILKAQFLWGRNLNKGNPNPGNIGSDFGRFGLNFWTAIRADHSLNERRQEYLEELNTWRNAIAHQDFDAAKLGGTTTLHLTTVRQWRSSVNALAESFDNVMCFWLQTLLGAPPRANARTMLKWAKVKANQIKRILEKRSVYCIFILRFDNKHNAPGRKNLLTYRCQLTFFYFFLEKTWVF